VLAIVTAENAGPLDKGKFNTAKLLGGPQVDHYHQAIAVVVAETFEQARRRCSLVRWTTPGKRGVRPRGGGRTRLCRATAARAAAHRTRPAPATSRPPSRRRRCKLDATYTTPDQSHAMMEPHASIAAWDGDKLVVWTSNQMIDWGAGDLAKTLGMPQEKVRLISPFIGGGFGGKLFLRADAVLAALGARAAGAR
jgi:xanthine dehydrogenase YagR molybdenum-binding subunit